MRWLTLPFSFLHCMRLVPWEILFLLFIYCMSLGFCPIFILLFYILFYTLYNSDFCLFFIARYSNIGKSVFFYFYITGVSNRILFLLFLDCMRIDIAESFFCCFYIHIGWIFPNPYLLILDCRFGNPYTAPFWYCWFIC